MRALISLAILAIAGNCHAGNELLRLKTDISACLRAIDQKMADNPTEAPSLQQLRRKLAPVPLDRYRFRAAFDELVKGDLLAATLMGLLGQANIPVLYFDERDPGLCQGNQIAYFTPGRRREIGMCAHRGEILGRSLIGFVHESLHLFQFGKEPVKDLLTYPFKGTAKTSTRALRYTPHARYIEFDDNFSSNGQALLESFPPAVRGQIADLMLALDEIKTLYMMYPKGDRIQFVPKKPWVIPEERFFQMLDDKMRGDEGFAQETSDLRFSVAQLAPKDTRVAASDPDRHVKRLSPSWYAWLAKNRQYRGRPRREQLVSYLQDVNTAYEGVMRGLAKQAALKEKAVGLFKMFFTSARIMRGLLNYCVEMQANMQSKMLLYLFYRELSVIPPCDKIMPTQWEGVRAEENIYSASYSGRDSFDRIDQDIEKYTKRYVSRTQSYGPSYSFLYGYENFPHIFSPDACASYKEEFLDYRP